jgi:VCBS repeat-containing protein
LTSLPATVTLTVNPVDDPPVGPDTIVTTAEDTPVSVQPTATDPDSPVTFQLLSGPAHGTVTGGAFAPWQYTPAANYAGTDSFTYAIGGGGYFVGKTVFITVTPVNDAPTAADTPATTNEDTAKVITPPTNDVDGDQLTVALESGPAHGTAVQSAANSFLYTPAADFAGTDSFTYTASDGTAASPVRTVTITVNAVNDAPTVSAIGDVTAVYSDTIAPITVTASDPDSGTNLAWSQIGLPAGLTLAGSGGSSTISGTVTAPPAAYQVTVKACDPSNACGTSSFTITAAPETATVRLTQNNPHAVVTVRGAAPAMTFTARVTDAADGSFGDVNRIQAANLSLRLLPIGGGNPVACPVTITRRVLATATAPGFVDVSCSFAAGVKVDVYQVVLTATGSFAGSDESVLAVYDPQARGASGAGIVDLGGGNRGEYAFTAASDSKGTKGKVVYVEKDAQGNVVHRVFGPNLQAMAVSGSTLPITASITGKAVVDGVGNYGLIFTAVDGGASGDQFGLKITAPPGAPTWPSLTFAAKPVTATGVVTVR